MNIDELKQTIEQRTGVPADLLSGGSEPEIIRQAEDLLSFKQSHEVKRDKTTKEQFGEWLRASQGIEKQDAASAALSDIKETVKTASGVYPVVRDGGEVAGMPKYTTREQFAAWLYDQYSF